MFGTTQIEDVTLGYVFKYNYINIPSMSLIVKDYKCCYMFTYHAHRKQIVPLNGGRMKQDVSAV